MPVAPTNHPTNHIHSSAPSDVISPAVPAKRAEQNRAAQRAFRERKQRYIKELEVKATLLDARHGQLSDSETRHRDLRTMVERLTRERDVRIKERELWWREREEVFRIVDALRKDLEQLHGENERLKEVVFGLWQESREGSGTASDEMDVSSLGAVPPSTEPKKDASPDAATEPTNVSSGEKTDAVSEADVTAVAKPKKDGPTTSLGSIAFNTLIERGPNGTGAASTPSNANSLSDALLVDLKNRISYWDAERESLYRTASFPPIPMSSHNGTVTPVLAPETRSPAGQLPAGISLPPGVHGAVAAAPMPLPANGGGHAAPSASFMDSLFSSILSASGPFNGSPGPSGAGSPMPGMLPSHLSALMNNPAALQAALAASAKHQQQHPNQVPQASPTAAHPASSLPPAVPGTPDNGQYIMNLAAAAAAAAAGKPAAAPPPQQ
ncbi:hypothetical protein PhCBS80983_g03370 [Powellomyces hirtus]|uniref:BZIP domain-containing protein n=1 Tax=Powellomyces hirtus TaxID=109895 RepID=A0A507E4P3_9FUNG|nr:hypothetical protein PhCBS80983_g03370 [Powellomyces hirtus]